MPVNINGFEKQFASSVRGAANAISGAPKNCSNFLGSLVGKVGTLLKGYYAVTTDSFVSNVTNIRNNVNPGKFKAVTTGVNGFVHGGIMLHALSNIIKQSQLNLQISTRAGGIDLLREDSRWLMFTNGLVAYTGLTKLVEGALKLASSETAEAGLKMAEAAAGKRVGLAAKALRLTGKGIALPLNLFLGTMGRIGGLFGTGAGKFLGSSNLYLQGGFLYNLIETERLQKVPMGDSRWTHTAWGGNKLLIDENPQSRFFMMPITEKQRYEKMARENRFYSLG